MNKKIKENLYHLIKERVVSGYDPRAIYIFGSFARGEETEMSDIDILIEKETDQKLPLRSSYVRSLLRGIAYPLDILVYTSKEINEKKNDQYSVVYNALVGGIKIYERQQSESSKE
ncbi:MAG: nucleotidyltransferase domain-containing protein [Candidatus Margulisiibacteriota bacterium]|nr:MAG: hypothetical protein A2X09_15125 [Bacteroidetes bacterium GWF2_43_11]OGH99540.1 MAG: hypothetical protein A2X43_00165 [Candidatus Margulisbacteria bacterium GWD2_39_127]PZM79887.1 MAG: nucleotidyltransferase domain-containing protein [Candidatus Margulisiibacteriota bacterium]HAR62805.1 DNA polymerase III subunit beta [Candidatus Margulisiibacteriota bacterium]HCT86563.1 DNA polymerase III subunit beta [Candidatus Margulisiibacteriota bacterium]